MLNEIQKDLGQCGVQEGPSGPKMYGLNVHSFLKRNVRTLKLSFVWFINDKGSMEFYSCREKHCGVKILKLI